MQQCVAASQTRFCAEVPVTCIPANYRKRLPRQARLCYVEEPVWDADNACYFTHLGSTPQSLASSRSLRLSIEEAEMIFRSLDTPAIDEQPLRGIPSYLLPDALRDMDGSHSYDLGDELAQAMLSHALMSTPTHVGTAGSTDALADVPVDASSPCRLYDHWFVAPTSVTDDQGRCLVSVAPLAHRLSGRSSGPVYSVWLDTTTLEQAMPVDASFDHLDCHEQRMHVNAFALGHGATPPAEEPEQTRVDEAAFTATTLEDQYHLVALKDPLYLHKEDVLALSSDAEPAAPIAVLDTQTILTNAIAAVQRDQASLAQQRRHDNDEVQRLDILLRCLEETLDWYSHLPRSQRGIRILSLLPLDYGEDEPVHGWRQKRQARCIQLVVGVPTTLPLPWQRIASRFVWPKGKLLEQGKPRISRQEVHAERPSMIIRQAIGVHIVA